jgi:superfamily II RNA helicase
MKCGVCGRASHAYKLRDLSGFPVITVIVRRRLNTRHCERSAAKCGNLQLALVQTASAVKLPRSDVNFDFVQTIIDHYIFP